MQSETNDAPGLPQVIDPADHRPSLARADIDSGFLSQLIAERDNLPAQRPRRRAAVATAVVAYGEGERRDVRRLPQGFFRTLDA